jgi:hypothetical protein
MSSPIPVGWQWNQAELERGDALNAGFLSLLVLTDDRTPELIGTAFLVTANGNHATAVTAAHCFEEVRKILKPHPSHHLSTPKDFLPPPEEIELRSVKAIYLKGDRVWVCSLELGIWDSAIDLAVFTVIAPDDEPDLFKEFFWIDNQIPAVGEEIAMLGFGEMKVIPDPEPGKGTIQRMLIVRVGRVEDVFPDRHFMLKGPCIQTSIAIFGGMSGGVVARWSGLGTSIKPFAFISHAPDPQPSYDRSQSGHSMASILNARITVLRDAKQILEFKVSDVGVGRHGDRKRLVTSFEFMPATED